MEETIGRKYQRTWFELHSRKPGDDKWYGNTVKYKDPQEVIAALSSLGKQIVDVGGGLTIDTGPANTPREFRVVRVVGDCEVIDVQRRMI